MKRLICLTLVALSVLCAGLTIDATTAQPAAAAPKKCHGHNPACDPAPTPGPSLTLTVSSSTTTLTGTGFAASTRVQERVMFFDAFGLELGDITGYDTSGADGSLNTTIGAGYPLGATSACATASDGVNTATDCTT